MTKNRVNNTYNSFTIEELENRLLGSTFYDNDALLESEEIITVDTFTIEENKQIYKAMLALYKRSVEFDDILVINELSSTGISITDTLKSHISELYSTTTAVGAKGYAQALKEKCDLVKIIKYKAEIDESHIQQPMTSMQMTDKLNELAVRCSDLVTNNTTNTKIEINIDEFLLEIEDRIYKEEVILDGIPFGFSTLDRSTGGVEKGYMITIAGDSGSGKSAIMLQFALNMARYEAKTTKRPIVVFSLEMTKKQLTRRLLSMVTGLSGTYLRNPRLWFIHNNISITKDNVEKMKEVIAKGIKYLESLPFIIDDTSKLSANAIIARVKKLKLQYGELGCVYVDYAGLVNNGLGDEIANLTETFYALTETAKNTQIPFIVLNQLLKDCKYQKYYMPTVQNLKGSTTAFNCSHLIFLIWRADIYADVIEENPDMKGKCRLICGKARETENFGFIPMEYVNGMMFKES